VKLVAKSTPGGYFKKMSGTHDRLSGKPAVDPDSRIAGAGRRSFLGLAAWGVAAALLPGVASARVPLPAARRLSFYNLHTDERVETCYWENGTYVPTALEQIDTVLRDHRTGETRQMSPALIDLVFALTALLGTSAPVQVISGYRSPATNALLRAGDPGQVAENSLHLTGEAVDLRFENRPLRRVRDAALSLRAGGVGYYPSSRFVHLDVGRPRRW
jgi:uncharacterized protein YcbK (DUF882 family)